MKKTQNKSWWCDKGIVSTIESRGVYGWRVVYCKKYKKLVEPEKDCKYKCNKRF